MAITFEVMNDDGDEIEVFLPSKKVVCDGCDGHGTHLTPSMRDHAYSSEEFHGDFSEEEQEQYMTRGGMFDVTCETCKGKNVIDVIDRQACTSDEDKKNLARFDELEKDRREHEAECASERRMGALSHPVITCIL